MPSPQSWKVPSSSQPRAQDYHFDLDRALSAVVALHCIVPSDAYTAETLGTDRAGNGVVIDDDLILTIGYLLLEAETVWIHPGDGRIIEGTVLGVDQQSGFGLVQALRPLALPAIPLGNSGRMQVHDDIVVGGAGGRTRSVAGQIAAREEFAGYWEYLVEDAIFTAPSHPNWGGTALICPRGELVGIGSLQIERTTETDTATLNMIVPINLLHPVLPELRSYGAVVSSSRPWIGVYATDVDGRITIIGIAPNSPAERAGLRTGDIILGAGGKRTQHVADFYRALWAQGPAGTDVQLMMHRGRTAFDVIVPSHDRHSLLRKPVLQ